MRLLFILAALLAAQPLFAQLPVTKCGSEAKHMHTKPQLANIKQASQTAYAPDTCIDRTFNIIAYIFRDSLLNYHITEQQILDDVAAVNIDFERTCFQFHVCQFIYVDNWQYDDFVASEDDPEMQTLLYEEGYINMYFATGFNSFECIFIKHSSKFK